MPSHDKNSDGGAMRSLLNLFRLSKKKKEKGKKDAVKTGLAEPPAGAGPSSDLPQAPEVFVNTQAATTPGGAEVASDVPKSDERVEIQPGDAPPLPVQHAKLLAALESNQNTADPLQNSARMSFNVADLSGMLFAQRTNTQSGTGMVLPARMAEGAASGVQLASGINSGEAPLQRILEDGTPGSYAPYATTTVAPLHSTVNNALHPDGSNTLYSVANNLQEMLYADYDTLERIQTRQTCRDSVSGAMAVGSSDPRREVMKPPRVLLGMGDLQVLAAEQGPDAAALAAKAKASEAGMGQGRGQEPAVAMVAAAGAHTSRSAPLVYLQLQQQQQQQQQHAVGRLVSGMPRGAERSPSRLRDNQGLALIGQTQGTGSPVGLQMDGTGAQAAQAPTVPPPQTTSSPLKSSTPPVLLQQQQGEPQHLQAMVLAAGAQQDATQDGQRAAISCVSAAAKASVGITAAGTDEKPSAVPPQGNALEASALQVTITAVTAAAVAPPEAAVATAKRTVGAAPKVMYPEVNLRRVPAPKQISSAAFASGGGGGGISSRAGAIGSGGNSGVVHAQDFASVVAGPALPSYSQRPAPLTDIPATTNRPMKLTTACLSAYTTLYDNGADQSFQRALQRKMQLVFKWLQASDLTAPPDPRLEVPLDSAAAANEAADAADGAHVRSGNADGVSAADEGTNGLQGKDASHASPEAAATVVMEKGHRTEPTGIAAAAPAGGTFPLQEKNAALRFSKPAGRSELLAADGWGLAAEVSLPAGGPAPTKEANTTCATLNAPLQKQPSPADLDNTSLGHDLLAPATYHDHQEQQQKQPQQNEQPTTEPGCTEVHPSVAVAGESRADGATAAVSVLAQPVSCGDYVATTIELQSYSQPGPAVKALQGVDPTLTAATAVGPSQQLQLPLQHSLSDLYGNPQPALGSNLPPRMLAGSEADPVSATITAALPDPAAVAATPANAAGAAAAVPASSRMSGRNTAMMTTTTTTTTRTVFPVEGTGPALPAAGNVVIPATAPAMQQEQQQQQQEQQQQGAASASAQSSNSGAAISSGPGRTKTIAVASHCPIELQSQPSPASWTIDDFSLLKKLYEGSLSVVCQAQHRRSGRHVALKIYKRSRLHEMERFQLAREICLHIRIVHPNVVALYAAWKDSKYVYLALDWAPLGNMFDFLVSRGGRLSEEEAARVVMRPLMSALAFLHNQHFIHRDVKLENLLLDASNCLKLADFGLAIDQKFEQANTRLGTFGYFAPEVLDCPLKKGPFDLKDASGPGYDSRVDVWSAGVVGYEVLTGRAPFSASSPAKIIQAIRTRVLEFPGISEEGKDFLRSALTRDPAARPTAKQLLSHPWIVRHCGNSTAVAPLPPHSALPPQPPLVSKSASARVSPVAADALEAAVGVPLTVDGPAIGSPEQARKPAAGPATGPVTAVLSSEGTEAGEPSGKAPGGGSPLSSQAEAEADRLPLASQQ
ncbi:hypothetical protein Vretimale_16686 [Volvox reticuliferus]|uniref:Protein kinase domain-containing protein n=1 Tax=Volvox reticuliferus TaxID=1737510 RepID=A0A8J4FJP7_9CHLO|nr:hypothetical protein Vretifemale_8533 [Volvox reticuliferus]GIM13619.1 hypothetical protein Vretimale_16686 [Volvox reticuliferus]